MMKSNTGNCEKQRVSGFVRNIVWTVLVNGTGSFVKAILKKRMKFEESQIDAIWKSLSGGVESYVR